MLYKKIIPCIYMKGSKAVAGFNNHELFSDKDVISLAGFYGDSGADELLVFDLSETEEEHEESIGILKDICRKVDIPVLCGGNVKRVEDVKKILYAGCSKALLNFSKQKNRDLLETVAKRFGKDKIAVSIASEIINELINSKEVIRENAETAIFLGNTDLDNYKVFAEDLGIPIIPVLNNCAEEAIVGYLKIGSTDGVSGSYVSDVGLGIMEYKHRIKDTGINVNCFESSFEWKDFKKNSDGMIPVIVQDYKTDEVLMMAYMNQEAYELTVKTGRMTYYSRSRQELWIKGLTSGHFQYVKALLADCDSDTILAKVAQVGAACHTGNRSCFYTDLVAKSYKENNPLKVFEDVYGVIEDRKKHPKEGSYTNYLFEKGIDKILKKVGEEAAEIIIAAKNPDPEEIKYEISDFLYHVMVLMAEKGVTWEDITRELAQR